MFDEKEIVVVAVDLNGHVKSTSGYEGVHGQESNEEERHLKWHLDRVNLHQLKIGSLIGA